ncbi:conserved protein [Tepidicaulis marinus]|uniref:Conserved protein n=2 Tax=Tepidicaulis marinus TaxID=1333998 RepID=A0A081B7P2_9HYPH|nr:conserved protein [Tepidicaulis marinus]
MNAKTDTSLPAIARLLGRLDGRMLFWLLVLAGVLLALSDFAYHRHEIFDFEAVPLFYAGFAAASVLVLVLAGGIFRALFKRGENFYAPFSTDSEPPLKAQERDHA